MIKIDHATDNMCLADLLLVTKSGHLPALQSLYHNNGDCMSVPFSALHGWPPFVGATVYSGLGTHGLIHMSIRVSNIGKP
jgi:hypothetical protein